MTVGTTVVALAFAVGLVACQRTQSTATLPAANPQAAEKFVRAFRRGVDFMNQNKEEGIRLMVEFAKLDPEIARSVQLDVFNASIDTELMQKQADLMFEHRLLEKKMDIQQMIYKPAK